MNPKLLILLLIVLLISGWRFFVSPLLQDINGLKASLESQEKIVQEREAERDKLKDYKAQLKTLTEEKEKMQVILPSNIETEELLVELTKIVKRSGMNLGKISISSVRSQRQTKKSGESVAAKKANINLSLKGTYSALKNLLIPSIEKDLRLMDIEEITFSSERVEKEEQATEYNFQLKITTYYY